MSYTTTWHDHGVVFTLSGDITAAEIERANHEFFRDPRSDDARYQVVDAREVSSVVVRERDVKAAAAFDKGAEVTIKDLRVAYVTSDDHIRSLMEMYIDVSRRMNSSWRFKGFEDPEAALTWAKRS